MTERHFDMRLTCRYGDPDNTIKDLLVEILDNDQWRPLGLGVESPGFQIFVYAIFSCQHLYMRANCGERGLMLSNAKGRISVSTTENWTITHLHVAFDAQLRSGIPTKDDIDYITGRMGQCPASINLRPVEDLCSEIRVY